MMSDLNIASKPTRAIDIENAPRLNCLLTAVPEHCVTREETADVIEELFSELIVDRSSLMDMLSHTQIEKRYTHVPARYIADSRSFKERNDLSIKCSVDIGERLACSCLEQTGMTPDDIDGIVVVNTTSVCVPSIDALLIERLGLRRNIRRLPVYGLGCVGGTLGLGHAAMMARSEGGMKVLLLVIEMECTTIWKGDVTKNSLIAAALFGDGAAGAIVSCEGDGPAVTGWGEYTWPNSLDLAGWKFMEGGLGVVFSRKIPLYVRNLTASAVNFYLQKQNMTQDDIDVYALHPGGPLVMKALMESLQLSEDDLIHSKEILRQYSNMSAPTVLFVLERALRHHSGRFLAASFGPGFTAGFVTVEK